MKEREPTSVSIINLLGNSILGSLVPDFEQLNPVISWQKFVNLNLKVGSYGLDLTQVPSEAIEFLKELIATRMSEDQRQWDDFLEKTNDLPEDFFTQPLGQFKDPNITPFTLSQLNAAITKILSRGVKFDFNGHDFNGQKE